MQTYHILYQPHWLVARLRDNGAGLNFFVRTAMVGRETPQRAVVTDDEDAASTTFFQVL